MVWVRRLEGDIAARGGCEPEDWRMWALERYRELKGGFVEWEDEVAANADGGKGGAEFGVFGTGA